MGVSKTCAPNPKSILKFTLDCGWGRGGQERVEVITKTNKKSHNYITHKGLRHLKDNRN